MATRTLSFLSFAAGIAVAGLFRVPPALCAVPAALCAVPAFFLRDRRPAALLLWLAAGALLTHARLRIPDDHVSLRAPERIAAVEGVVVGEPERSLFGTRATIALSGWRYDGGRRARGSGLVRLTFAGGAPDRYDAVRAEASLASRRPPDPEGFPAPPTAAERAGVLLEGRAVRWEKTGRRAPPAGRLVGAVRAGAQRLLNRRFRWAPEERALVEALSIGGGRIPPFLRELGVRTGTYHVLVVSGLHIGFVYLLLRLFAFPFRTVLHRRPWFFPAAALAVLWLYTGVTGMEAPVLRAALMITFFLAGEIAGRDISPLDSVLLAAWILLAIDPTGLFDAGWQLSFAATAGILAVPRAAAAAGLRRFPLREPLLISLGAQAFTLPLVLHHFGVFHPAGLLANLAVVPAAGATTILAFLFFLAPPVFALPLRTAARLLLGLLAAVAQRSPALPVRFDALLALCCAALVAAAAARRRRLLAAGLTAAAAACLAVRWGFRPAPAGPEILIFPGADSAALIERDSCVVLCPDTDRDRGIERRLAPALRRRGVRAVDALLHTRVGPGRVGALRLLSRSLRVRDVSSFPCARRLPGEPLLAEACRGRTNVRVLRTGDGLSAGGWEIRLLAEPAGAGGTAVYRVRRGAFDLVLMPSADGAAARAAAGLRARVLAVGRADGTKAVGDALGTIDVLHTAVAAERISLAPAAERARMGTLVLGREGLRVGFDRLPFSLSRPP